MCLYILFFASCGVKENDGSVPPGTMKVISVVPLDSFDVSRNLINNGNFSEFWAGADLPTSFGLGAAAKSVRILRAPGDGAAYSNSIRQVWSSPDGTFKADDRFHVRVEGLVPNTDYRLSVTARVDDGTLVAIDIDALTSNGPKRVMANAIRFGRSSELPESKAITFNSSDCKEVLISSKVLEGSQFPATANWFEWNLRQCTFPPGNDRTAEEVIFEDSLKSMSGTIREHKGIAAWNATIKPYREQWAGLAALKQESVDDTVVGQQGFQFRRDGIRSLLMTNFVCPTNSTPSKPFRALHVVWQSLSVQKIPLLIAIVPSRTAVQADKLFPVVPAGDLMPARVEFVRALALAGVPVHDLGEAFYAVNDPGSLFLATDNQLTAEGVNVVVGALAARIKRDLNDRSLVIVGNLATASGLTAAFEQATGVKVRVGESRDSRVPVDLLTNVISLAPSDYCLAIIDTESLLVTKDDEWTIPTTIDETPK